MTGMVTASWMPLIIDGSLMRATPPSRRMSAGTRSSAITAAAPASSAIFACSGVTTSMITPPLSISASPALVRNVASSRIRPIIRAGSVPTRPTRRSARRRHGEDRAEPDAAVREPLPAVAGFEEAPVGGRDEQGSAGGRDERVRHRLVREDEAAPPVAVGPVQVPAGALGRVRGAGAGGGREVPALGVARVEGERPAVPVGAALVEPLPRGSAVVRARRGVARGLVRAPRSRRVPGELMGVAARSRAVILERGPAVVRAHEPAELDADEDALRVVRVGGDPAHAVRPGARREAPARFGRDVLERLELGPGVAVVGHEEP